MSNIIKDEELNSHVKNDNDFSEKADDYPECFITESGDLEDDSNPYIDYQ